MDLHYDGIAESDEARVERVQREARERNERALRERYGDASPRERNLVILGRYTNRPPG